MTTSQKSLVSGPKTEAGKAVASKNARKDSLFVKAYLPHEDAASQQALFAQLRAQWRADDPSRLILLRSIEQAQLGIERMLYIEQKKLTGIMQSVTIAKAFCERAGLPEAIAEKLPAWFFINNGGKDKQHAARVAEIYDEANQLKSQYSDQLAAQVKDCYPALHQYVMVRAKESSSFIMTLGQRYGQSAVTLNLAALMNELNDRFPYHFVWAEAPERYQAIIDGLRAEQMEAAIDFEKSTRYATNFENRIIKGYSALAALDQHEALIKQGL
jgi:hypothetical protein